jgi:SAM-dependent methyltransferase
MSEADADTRREEMLDGWERAAEGWGKRAERVREMGMPVSIWMIEQLSLQPGQRVLELAAGPGDTGFLAAELIAPGGTLVSSDGTEAMLEVARERAVKLGVGNVEFARLELEWIDLPTATVDAVLCRWGLMLSLDPAAGAREARRVLRPGGRIAVAVWDQAATNPWATVPARALIAHGLAEPPDPDAPGMFALAEEGSLQGLLEDAGFVEVIVEPVPIERHHRNVAEYLEETLDLSHVFSTAIASAPEDVQTSVRQLITESLAPFTQPDGSLVIPGRSLVAAANA